MLQPKHRIASYQCTAKTSSHVSMAVNRGSAKLSQGCEPTEKTAFSDKAVWQPSTYIREYVEERQRSYRRLACHTTPEQVIDEKRKAAANALQAFCDAMCGEVTAAPFCVDECGQVTSCSHVDSDPCTTSHLPF
ncbi:hypothetical protein CGMCC3_g13095 [Colletotrichum fructicola]|nr:uncharacterized protein CGMCC3_g13095 [Colletotrichum fructicola]KAE9570791.1 hypothetical protein CGMCC3_g13095 [Colletotrichum fructicola]